MGSFRASSLNTVYAKRRGSKSKWQFTYRQFRNQSGKHRSLAVDISFEINQHLVSSPCHGCLLFSMPDAGPGFASESPESVLRPLLSEAKRSWPQFCTWPCTGPFRTQNGQNKPQGAPRGLSV